METAPQTMKARAVIVPRAGEAPRVETIEVAPPGVGEVRVKILASGVCHTDLHAQRGHFGRSFPYLLGHEGAGVVEAVGDGVTDLGVGEHVMLNWRAPCHRCRFCRAGRPTHCERPRVAADARLKREDGASLGRVLGLGTFTTHTVVAAGQCIPVSPALSPLATCLIGCGVITGVGAAIFAAQVKAGEKVAVFGCGAVGLSVVMGAKLARAKQIIAVDRVAKKLEWARELGATDVVDASAGDAVAAVEALSEGGVDHAFEAVGIPETLAQAAQSCALAGSCTMIGVPQPKTEVALSMPHLFYKRLTLRSTFYGDCLPARDFPLLADWYASGELPLDRFVSERIGLEEVGEAFAKMERGETIRSVIDLREPS
ncbi:MAG: Zn-dependent alcohol dehydrogenase [Polyangiaceae bacterium]